MKKLFIVIVGVFIIGAIVATLYVSIQKKTDIKPLSNTVKQSSQTEAKIYEETVLDKPKEMKRIVFNEKQSFDINKLKDTIEISFYEGSIKRTIKNSEYIQKFSNGIVNAKFHLPAGCPFDKQMEVKLKSGETIDMLIAGDDCDTILVNDNVFQIGNEMKSFIHDTSKKCNFDWWQWEKKPDSKLEQTDLEQIVSDYLIQHNIPRYGRGQVEFEVHHTFGTEVNGQETTLYLDTFFDVYTLNGDTLEHKSGGNEQVVMVVEKSSDGQYTVKSYKSPIDGGGQIDDIKKMFPKQISEKILNQEENNNLHREMAKQMEGKVKDWLKQQGKENAQIKIY